MRGGGIEVRALGPLIRIQWKPGAKPESHDVARAELARLFGRPGPYGVIVDLRGVAPRGLDEHRRTLELVVRHRARLAQSCVGFAVLVRGRAGRAAVAALTWFAAPPAPLRVFPHAMAAESWLRGQLERASVAQATG